MQRSKKSLLQEEVKKNVSTIPAIKEVCFSTLRTLKCKVLLYYANKAAAAMTSSDLVVVVPEKILHVFFEEMAHLFVTQDPDA